MAEAALQQRPRTREFRHRSPLGEWELICREPDPRLRGYVREYMGYVEGATSFRRRREVPGLDIPIIINFGAPFRLVTAHGEHVPARSAEYRTFVAGLWDASALVESAGPACSMQVNFTPIGARLVLGVPMRDLTNRGVELEEVLGATARTLAAQLSDAPDWERRFVLFESFVFSRLARARSLPADVRHAWRALCDAKGLVRIRSLTSAAGCSPRHLIDQFREHIGLPPKTVARILRFNRVIRRLRSDRGDVPWATIAQDCGYYDQAHFNRDFREFAGSTPSEYLGRCLPDHGGLIGD